MENLPYPRLEISLEKIIHNTSTLVEMCRSSGISVAGVTKVFCGNEMLAEAMVEGGIDVLADSRIENLKRYRAINLPKLFLRLPMISQAGAVIEFADISLNSEIETIRALSAEAILRGRVHQVVLMLDLGDFREGIYDPSEMLRTAQEIAKLEGVLLAGIGTNLTCLGAVIPTIENLSKLVSFRRMVEESLNTSIGIVSGGNSSSLYLIEDGTMPEGINQLRLGESIVLGRETAFGKSIKGTYNDSFKLVVEIIEVKKKPSVPVGEIGFDAYGKKPEFIDKGTRKRAICAIGKQDITLEGMSPDDDDIYIIGASGDHLILDITECNRTYKVGDLVWFNLRYSGILNCMSSGYVSKLIR